jgi:adenylate cyclase
VSRPRRRRLTSAWRRQVAFGFAAGLVFSALTTAASATGFLSIFHAGALDLLAWWKYLAPSPQIVLVGIDDRAFARLRAPQAIPRDYVAGVIRGALRSGARVIGIDVDLGTASGAGSEAALADAITQSTASGVPVVLSVVVAPVANAPGVWDLPPPVVAGAPVGFVADPADVDGIVRRFRALLPGAQGTPLPSFALAVLAATPQGLAPLTPAEDGAFRVTALSWRLRFVSPGPPMPASLLVTDRRARINYVGPSGTFVTIPSDAVAAAAAAAELPRNPLHGKIVLIGPTFVSSADRFATPKGEMTGVEVHANIVHTLLTHSWLTPLTWAEGFGAQALLSLVAAALFASLHPVEAGLVTLIAVAGAFVPLSQAVYGSGDFWIDLALPLLGVFIQVRAIDRLEQRRLEVSFARYVSPEVVRQVLSSRDATVRTEQREVTILFCDLRDSTGIGEKLSMGELMRLLNNYFELVTAAVFSQGGTINKFIGDGILAVYNAPVDVPKHADAAVQTALEIQSHMSELNKRWGDWLAARLQVGVGIHSGRVISGNVGSELKLEYTIIGDPVNVASRVEALTKELNARILITAATRAQLDGHYSLKSLGAVPIRGRTEPIELYEVT